MMRTVACLRSNCTLALAGIMSTQVLHSLGFRMQNSRYILDPSYLSIPGVFNIPSYKLD